MKRLLRLLRFLPKALLYVATIAGAVFSALPYFPQLKEAIGRFAKWLLPFLALPFWFWPSIALAGAMLLFLLARRRRLIELGSPAPQVLDRQKLRRKIQRRLKIGRFTKHCREIAGLYYLTRRDPKCSFVHGAALVLTAASSPFDLFGIVGWLFQKLTSTQHGFSYPLPTLKILADALHTQITKRHWSWLWPQKSQRRFRKLAMDTYNAVAHYGVEALERNLFFHWQLERLSNLPKDPQNAPLKDDDPSHYQEEWKRELEGSRDTALDLLETIANPIYKKWLSSLNTPMEVEEATVARIIPTLFALPINVSCGDNQVSTVISKMQMLAEQITASIWLDHQECGIKVWLHRLKLILKTNVLIYLWHWLDAGRRLTLLQRTFGELNLLYKEGYDQPIEIDELFAKFDQVLQQIHDQKKIDSMLGEFDKVQSENFLGQVKSFSKCAKNDGALPIAIICDDGIVPKLESVLGLI